MRVEFIPAILVKTREELLEKINMVKGHVNIIQLDIMDGEFVPNKTVGLEDLHDLPQASYEYHWMVNNPENYIEKTPGPHMHLVHIETVTDFEKVIRAVRQAGGRIGLALNPDTPLESIMPYIGRVEEVLVMTVRPGFSGQKYIAEMEGKIKKLRQLYPNLDIEVDGGINPETIGHAFRSGANYLAAASAIYKDGRIKENIEYLKGVVDEEKDH